MQIIMDVHDSCNHDVHIGCIYQVQIGGNRFFLMSGGDVEVWATSLDCSTALLGQDGNKNNKSLSENIPTIGHMNYTVMASTPITDFTIKAILKELISSTINKNP